MGYLAQTPLYGGYFSMKLFPKNLTVRRIFCSKAPYCAEEFSLKNSLLYGRYFAKKNLTLRTIFFFYNPYCSEHSLL